MGTLTPNYSLQKPAQTDVINVDTAINASMDTIDTNLKRVDDLATNPPRARAYQPSAIVTTLGNGAWTPITFTAEDFDTSSIHNTAADTDRFVIPSNGAYQLAGKISYAANGTGVRGCRWTKNGTALSGSMIILPNTTVATPARIPAATMTANFIAGDIIRLEGFQESGGNLDTLSAADTSSNSYAEIRKVAA